MLKKTIEKDRLIVEDIIKKYMDCLDNESPNTIKEAMIYSLESGGKRLRPILLIETFKLFSNDFEKIKGYIFAMEAIHTYSLIHDDLPAMDNDDFRRGKATNHKVFGEAIAILTGDSLLNYAMEVLIREINDEKTLAASRIISSFAGAGGMIGGQVMDIESENHNIDYKTLKKIHHLKTGKLISAAILSGGILGGADDYTLDSLKIYGDEIGQAFQIIDDVLDVVGTTEDLGKPIGSDEENKKVTYVSIFGIEKSKLLAEEAIKRALKAIEHINNSEFFVEFGKYLLERKS
ncbi:MAG: polyprenyl synthetase family protein [Filifactoraceae bacterium]